MVFDKINPFARSLFKVDVKGETLEEKALDFFEEIYSYDDLKEMVYRGIISDYNVNILLIGAPATAKTLFIRSMYENLKNTVYFDAANSTGKGIIQDLENHKNAKYILIDEIDKLTKEYQGNLLGLLETGEVNIAKTNVRIKFKMDNPKVFATSNSSNKLIKPLKSRFNTYNLKEYTDEEFILIAVRLLTVKYHFNSELARFIAEVLLDCDERDVRKVLHLAKLIRPKDDERKVKKIIDTYLKYQDNDMTEFN